MLRVDVKLVDHVVVSPTAALPNPNKLPVHLSDDHQTLSHSSTDDRLVPPPANLLIRSPRTNQRLVVASNVRVAEPADGRDITMFCIPQDCFDSRRHRVPLHE